MKNLNFLSLVLLMVFASNIYAQKVKLKDFDVTAKYTTIPKLGFENHITSYTVKILTDEQKLPYLNKSIASIQEAINIPGYTKFDEAVGAVIEIKLGIPTVTPRKLNKVAKKDKSGKTWTNYSYTHEFNQNSTVNVYDDTHTLIQKYSIKKTSKLNSSVHKSPTLLQKSYKANTKGKIPKKRKDLMNSTIAGINEGLTKQFGAEVKEVKIEFKTFKSKQHEDLADFTKIAKVVSDAFGKLTFDDNKEYVSSIQPVIEFWTTKEKEYDGSDKQERKLKLACQYNTALAFMWAEDLENAKKYATMIIEGDYKEKRGEKMMLSIKSLEKTLENSKRGTRFYKIEIRKEDFIKREKLIEERKAIIAIGDIAAFPDFDQKMNMNINSNVQKAILFNRSGTQQKGYFSFNSNDEMRPKFRNRNNNIFGYLENDEIQTSKLKYEYIDSIQVGNIMYRIRDVKISYGIMQITLKNAIVETVYEFDRTVLEIVHPPYKKSRVTDDELYRELTIWHKEKESYHATSGLMGYSKAMKKIVGDCDLSMSYVKNYKNESPKNANLPQIKPFKNTNHTYTILDLYDSCK